MIFPSVTSRMKQLRRFARFRINSSQIRTFVKIAVDTGKGQIVQAVRSSMNARDDVLDVQDG